MCVYKRYAGDRKKTLEMAIQLAMSAEAHQVNEQRRYMMGKHAEPKTCVTQMKTTESDETTQLLKQILIQLGNKPREDGDTQKNPGNSTAILQRLDKIEQFHEEMDRRRQSKCYNCGKIGHFSKDCRAQKKKTSGNGE